jgi:oligoendopeptidase F
MEGLAITAELTLPRYLYEHETDPALKRFFLDQLLASKGIAILFQTAAEGDLEERIYDGVARGEIHGASDLDALTVATFARYGIVAQPDQWTKIRLMFEDPFYDINYAWASVVALPLFGMSRSAPADLEARYSRAIGSAFDRPVNAWLRYEFGIDLRDPLLVRHALDTIQPYIDAMGTSNP